MAEDIVIAVDAGGAMIKSGRVSHDGSLLPDHRHPTGAERGPEATVETILQVTTGLVDAARADGVTPRAVGVAVPGIVDEAAGVATRSSHLGLRDTPLRDLVATRTGLPTTLCHDVRAGGVAEARLGAGRDARHVMFVAVGTEIAAAQVVGGHASTGAHGAAGGLGHVTVRPNGPPCTCGGRGCLEAVASADALTRRFAELGGGTAGAAEIAAAAEIGAVPAVRVWQEAVDALADGLVLAQALYDAELIVLGGGLAAAGEALFTPLRTAVKERLTFHRAPKLAPTALGDTAGCLGAGLRAWDAR